MIKRVGVSTIVFLIGIVYVYSAISKYQVLDIYEISLVEQKIAGWSYTRFLARLIIGFELALGLLLIFHYRLKTLLKINIVILSIFSLLLAIQILLGTELENCFCFGENFQLTNTESILKNGILIIFSILALKFDSVFEIKKGHFLLITFSTFLLTTSTICILYPPINIYEEFNIDTFKTGDEFPKLDSLPNSIYRSPTILALLSPKCGHCYQAALKLSILEKTNTKYEIVPVFGFGRENIDEFILETKVSSKWYMIDKKDFLKLTKGRFPQIYILENGKIVEVLNKRKFIEKNLD